MYFFTLFQRGISRLVRFGRQNNNSQRSPCHNLLDLWISYSMLGFTAMGFNVVDGIKVADQQVLRWGQYPQLSQ